MFQLDNPEHTHVGRALQKHAEALTVTMGMLERFAGPGGKSELEWSIAAHDLSVLRIRRFHWVLIEAFEHLDNKPPTSMGFREQWFTTSNDQVLYHNVLASGRRAVWWWGGARTERGSGAVCWLCNELIHTYDLGRGVTHPVRLAVMNHRAKHIADLLGITSTRNGRKRV